MLTDLQKSLVDINPDDFTQAIDAAANILQKERQQGHIIGGKISRGGFIELQLPESLVIIGDIHGDSRSFFKILEDIKFERFLSNPHNKIIFLGDYVDRGSNSIGILYAICYLKQKYPQSIILMRGNHEAPVEFPFSSHDLPYRIIEQYGEKLGKLIYTKNILPFFQSLCLILLIKNKLLMVHGGLPTEYNERLKINFARYDYHFPLRIMEEILWNDPMEQIQSGQDWESSRRGFGKHFGINISRKWLSLSASKVIVRGHEPCHGFKIDHQGMIMTLFSCKEAYPKFQAAYVSLSGEELRLVQNGADLSHHVIRV